MMMSSGYGELASLPAGSYPEAIASAPNIAALDAITYVSNDGLGTFAPSYKVTKVMVLSIRAQRSVMFDPRQFPSLWITLAVTIERMEVDQVVLQQK